MSIQADERGDEVLRLRETRNILKSFGNSLDALLNPFFRDDEFDFSIRWNFDILRNASNVCSSLRALINFVEGVES